jgi:hypothetical protein
VTFEVEDALTGKFLGTASVACSAGKFQAMLLPRFEPGTHAALLEDADALGAFGHDDFGYLCGCVLSEPVPLAPPCTLVSHQQAALPTGLKFPVGCALRVSWLSAEAESGRYSVHADFGGHGNFAVGSVSPLFVSVGSAEDCVVTLRARHTVGGAGDTASEASFRLPLHLIGVGVDLSLPVQAADALSSLLLISVTVTESPEIPSAPMTVDFGRSPPNAPPSLFHAAAWESEQHIAFATERRWRRSTVTESSPQPDHLRHLLDVIRGSCELSPTLLPLVRAFFNIPAESAQPAQCDLRQLLVAMAFACTSLDFRDAALLAFEAAACQGVLSQDGLRLILESSLVPKSVDLSGAQLRQRAVDLVTAYSPAFPSGADGMTLAIYDAAIARNVALWSTLGCTIASSGLKQPRSAQDPTEDSDTWRHFVVRVSATNLAFAVTAHRDDTFRRVTKQIEDAIGVPAAKQLLQIDRSAVDFDVRVGAVIAPSEKPVQQVVVSEAKDSVTVTCVYRAKSMKFEVTSKPSEKILRLRALVQQKTNVPLSRLSLSFGGSELLDRHALAHYGIFDASVIEVKAS